MPSRFGPRASGQSPRATPAPARARCDAEPGRSAAQPGSMRRSAINTELCFQHLSTHDSQPDTSTARSRRFTELPGPRGRHARAWTQSRISATFRHFKAMFCDLGIPRLNVTLERHADPHPERPRRAALADEPRRREPGIRRRRSGCSACRTRSAASPRRTRREPRTPSRKIGERVRVLAPACSHRRKRTCRSGRPRRAP